MLFYTIHTILVVVLRLAEASANTVFYLSDLKVMPLSSCSFISPIHLCLYFLFLLNMYWSATVANCPNIYR